MRALITRPRENAGPITGSLAERDVDVLLEPLLEIAPTEHEPIEVQGVQALLVTSAFGVRELAKDLTERGIPIFAVGDATAEAARAAGFVTVESARGDVRTLAELVKSRLKPEGGPLLYAAGRTTAGDLPEQLAEAGFETRRVEVYAARPAAALSIEAVSALRAGTLDMALFFSPRTAATFVRLVMDGDLAQGCRGITAFCLSQAVADSLQELPWKGIEVAERPEQQAMVGLIENWIERQRTPETEDRQSTETATDRVAPEPDPSPPRAPQALVAPVPTRSSFATTISLLTLVLLLAGVAGGYLLWRDQNRLANQIQEVRQPLAQDPAFNSLDQRVGTLQSRIGDDLVEFERRLTARTAEGEQRVAALSGKIDTLSSQLGADNREAASAEAESLEAIRKQSQELATRVAAIEDAKQQDAESVRQVEAALTAKLAEIEKSNTGRMEAVTNSLQQLAATLKTLDERITAIAQTAKAAADDNSAVLLVTVGQIRAALESGGPFSEPLTILRRSAGDDARLKEALGTWTNRAAEGIPTIETLRQRFQDLASGIESPIQPDTGQRWLDSALERATSVVRIRRVGSETPGATPTAILGRAEAALNRRDLAGAVSQVDRLPPDTKATFENWLSLARARLQARDAIAAIERVVLDQAGGG